MNKMLIDIYRDALGIREMIVRYEDCTIRITADGGGIDPKVREKLVDIARGVGDRVKDMP